MAAAGPGNSPTELATTGFDTDLLESMMVLEDRYAVRFRTDHDATSFTEAISSYEDGEQTYEMQIGDKWELYGQREQRSTAGVPLDADEDAVYVRQGTETDRFTRSYYDATPERDAMIEITVPRAGREYALPPLYNALDPFLEDGRIIEAVDAVDERIDQFYQDELTSIRI